MRIGILGAGRIGATLARLLVAAGHEVVIANSRGPEGVADVVADVGAGVIGATAEQAAEAGEVVVVAIPFARYRSLPAAALAGKVVVDVNNYAPGRDGPFPEIADGTTTSSELLAASLPGAQVVKALNTIYYVHLADDGTPAGTPSRRAIPLAGDDSAAKATVAALLDDIGFDSVDVGSLADGRRIEPGSPVYNVALTRDQVVAALA